MRDTETVTLERRQAGRTLGGLLQVLGTAIANPGEKQVYVDHAILEGVPKREIHNRCRSNLVDIIDSLSLDEIEVSVAKNNTLEVVCSRKPLYVGDNGHIYQIIE